MKGRMFFGGSSPHFLSKLLVVFLCSVIGGPFFYAGPAIAVEGETLQTAVVPMELPVEVEIELSPAGSLKQAAVWKELIQLIRNPYAPVVRRSGFGVDLPPLNVYPLDYNFLTGQPMRLRTSDGEVSWDQPGPLFDTAEKCVPDGTLNCIENTPTDLRTVVGHLVACPDNGAYQAADVPVEFCAGKPDGSLVVYNPDGNASIPENGTVVAVAAVVNGVLQELDGESTTNTVDVEELEIPINEEDFFRPVTDTAGVPNPLRDYIGRHSAEVLGKALFWDMQIGSDGVQACGSCHFQAGVDNRTRGQRNPNTNGPSATAATLEALFASNTTDFNSDVLPGDFPFHKLADPRIVTDSTVAGGNLISDSNDVMSSMGVSRFKTFVDIPAIGNSSFGPASPVGGVKPLLPDTGTAVLDPVPANEGFRRVEPRNTPTFHGTAFNFDNFWDGRARFNFNGGSVFGPSDPTAHIFIDPANPGPNGGNLQGATNGHIRPELIEEGEDQADQPVRIKFSSLASQSVGPPLSDFEMSFAGRNWAKIGKKMLQGDSKGQDPVQALEVTPLANQLVANDDSRLAPFSNQGGSVCATLGRPTAVGKPGLCISYGDLIRLAFDRHFWHNNGSHLNGAACTDPFDGYCLTVANGGAAAANTNQFRQIEANFSLFFALSVQAYETLTIPDHTLADQFFDANPNAGHGVGEPGDQAVLFPTLIPDLLDDELLNNSEGAYVTLIPDDPATPEYDGFGPDEIFGFDLFVGANLTAAIEPAHSVGGSGRVRNPAHTLTNANGEEVSILIGSNPFTRSAKCMLCHLGPEQTDHSINISHGVLKNDAEFEYPTPPVVPDPNCIFEGCLLPAPEPSGASKTVPGLILSEEVTEGAAQDAVEVEPRNFATFDDPLTPWDDRTVAQPGNFAFGDQGIYNVGVRPIVEDKGRGNDDPFGMPLSLSALTLKNIGGTDFEPCDGPLDLCLMETFDAENLELTFEESGDGILFPDSTHELESINPGFERDPINPQLPEYMVPWMHGLPAGELHPQIDEMAGMVPNTVTAPNGGPGIEFPEIMFGADLHCASYNPDLFGLGPPNFGWGAPAQTEAPSLCPQHQSGVAGNFEFPVHGTWPVPNRVLREGAFKAPPLRNVEMTAPYFHTGSYLTLRQVVDFYFRGGDFPLTNADARDPHIVNIEEQAFAFGRTSGDDLLTPLNHLFSTMPPFTLAGTFGNGLPDTVFRYDAYPDSDHPVTPELGFASREEALEDAKNALVKFLLSLTDPRVRYEKAPFDRPEIFVPIDGLAPENTLGPADLTTLSNCSEGTPCAVNVTNCSGGPCLVTLTAFTTPLFRHLPAVGSGGNPTALPNFLGVLSTPGDGSCSASAGTVTHFCAVVNP